MFNVYICNFLSDSLVPSVFLPPSLLARSRRKKTPAHYVARLVQYLEREFRAIEHIMSAIGIIKTGSSFLLLPSFFFLLIQQPLSCCAVGLIGVNGKKELETWRKKKKKKNRRPPFYFSSRDSFSFVDVALYIFILLIFHLAIIHRVYL